MSGQRPFRFGVQVAGRLDARTWTAIVRRAEEVGFSTLLVPDHLDGNLAPWAALANAAAITRRLRVGTYVLNNDLRHPVVVAHEAATLDLLSGGRLELGIGAGWSEPEYRETGLPFDAAGRRIKRLAESVFIIKALLRGERLSFHGDFYEVQKHQLEKPSPQKPQPPILIGGNGNRLLTIAAQEADIVAFLGFSVVNGRTEYTAFTPDGLDSKVALVRGLARHRTEDVELSALVWYFRSGSSPRAAAEATAYDPALSLEDVLASPFTLFGRTADMVAKLRDSRDRFGITYWVVGVDDIEPMAFVIDALAGQ